MEETAMYDLGSAAEDLESRSAAALAALEHESANLREAAEMRAKTALDLKATSDAQVKVASTVNLINHSLTGAFRALDALRKKIVAYKEDTAQAAEELLAEAEEIEASLRANQEETFDAVTQVLGSALGEISGAERAEAAEKQAGREQARTEEKAEAEQEEPAADVREEQVEQPAAEADGKEAAARAEDIDRRVPPIDDLDEPDGVGPEKGRPSAVDALAAERDEYRATLERERAEHAAEIAGLKSFLEEQAASMVEKILAEREAGVAQPKAGEGVLAAETGEPAEDKVPAEQASPAEDVPEEPDLETEEGVEGQEAPNAGTGALGEDAVPAEQAEPAAAPAPRMFTRTHGFGGDAATRVEDIYAQARERRGSETSHEPYAPALRADWGNEPVDRETPAPNEAVSEQMSKRGY